MKKLREIELKEGKVYKFIPIDRSLGRAEFVCCPVYKHGKLKEFYFFPVQQKDIDYYYKKTFSVSPLDFSISSWTYKGIDIPKIWLHAWCKEHKCQSFRLYVPANSNCFTVDDLSNFSINFDKE